MKTNYDIGIARRLRVAAVLCFSGCALLTTPGILAQSLERRDTVAQRDRPEFKPIGIRVSTMMLQPSIGGELRFNDNVFADDTNKTDDTAFILTPKATLNSESPRHRAQIGISAELARYADEESEDYEDAAIWSLASMALGRGEIEGEANYSQLHEKRTSPDDIRGSDLTEYTRQRVGVAYNWSPSRLLVRGDLRYTELDFDPTNFANGQVNNDDRDRSRAELGLRVGYGVTPDYAVYLETRIDNIDYDQAQDDQGFRRSSDGAEVRVGALLDFTGSTAGEFYIGYLERDYEDARFGKADGATLGAKLDWNITGLTTLRINAERTIDSTTIIGASGITRSRVALGVDHELRRNLILSAELGIGNDEFDGIDRDDDLAGLSIGGKYFMNRHLRVDFGYQYQDRDSSPANTGGRIYEISELFVRVVGQL